MRVTVSLIGLLLLPFVVGCEGNSPRRSPFAAPSTPTAAKTVEFAPGSKNPLPVARPAGDANPGIPANPGNEGPQPGVAANPAQPPAGGAVAITADKLEKQRELIGYHTAVFLAKEVKAVATGPVDENLNFVFRAGEGLDIRVQLPKAMDLYKANKGKPPQTVADFINYLDEQGVGLPELKPNEFYVYDPELAEKDSSKENLDYLKKYTN